MNTETGEEISRRQYQNLVKGISFEAKAKKNKEESLAQSLARPARGRTKAATQQEIEGRLEAAATRAELQNRARLERKAAQKGKPKRVKTIRPQLLRTGHLGERIDFYTYEDYEELIKQANRQTVGGKRLITAYGVGIMGIDERTGAELGATLFTLRSPRMKIDEDELEAATEDFIFDHPYFIFTNYFMHLAFNRDYAEGRAKAAKRKNIPKRAK